ncbi:hypothetical protein DFH09DRAFT_384509 [Mycena vulgaris]|nr:hypothetical protein DFH09DRAFT_384509 [Mycena vulgaris]
MACLLEILRLSGPSYAWPHSNCEVELLARYYGAQMTSTLLEFEDTVYGILPTEHPARLLQLNRFLTGGLTPSGEVNGYQNLFSDGRSGRL